ncbi:hypothetical protein ACEQ8H_008775 [Pleosporales sp. CAS-2024a]
MPLFVDLPPEIRNACYHELLSGQGTPSLQRTPHSLAMFNVSKQLHQETSSYFYHHNTFAVHVPSPTTEAATILPPIADKYLRHLSRLEIRLQTGPCTSPRTHKSAATISDLSRIGAQFEELHLLIGSRLSRIVNACVDDSIMGTWHPITMAVRDVLHSRVVKHVCLSLQDAWFAPNVARELQLEFGTHLDLYVGGLPAHDVCLLERAPTGLYSTAHLTDLGLSDQDTTGLLFAHQESLPCISPSFSFSSSSSSLPASLPSSLCSAFAHLDTFSLFDFELGSDKNNDDDDEDFFEDMMEDDDELEDVSEQELRDYACNLEHVAHDMANHEDMTYVTNFAPHLLLRRSHLRHLI